MAAALLGGNVGQTNPLGGWVENEPGKDDEELDEAPHVGVVPALFGVERRRDVVDVGDWLLATAGPTMEIWRLIYCPQSCRRPVLTSKESGHCDPRRLRTQKHLDALTFKRSRAVCEDSRHDPFLAIPSDEGQAPARLRELLAWSTQGTNRHPRSQHGLPGGADENHSCTENRSLRGKGEPTASPPDHYPRRL